MSIIGATSGELLKRLERGDLQSVDVVTAYLDAISAQDGKVNAFLHVDRERSLAQARAIDEKRRCPAVVAALACDNESHRPCDCDQACKASVFHASLSPIDFTPTHGFAACHANRYTAPAARRFAYRFLLA